MSSKDRKDPRKKHDETKKHKGNKTSAERPLDNASGNSSRRKKPEDPTEGITKSLRGVSLDGKSTRSTGKESTSRRTPRTQTATQGERSLTKAPKFIKVEVFGRFESQSRSAMVQSFMASSSQVPPTTQGDGEVSETRNVDTFGDNFHLVASSLIGDNKHAPVLGCLDTGASIIDVNRQYMLQHGLHEDDLNNSLVGYDKYVWIDFPDPLIGVGTVPALLHRDTFQFGGPSGSIAVDNQSFYVLERYPYPVLIGVGPPTGTGMVGHELKDAPTLLQTIAKQHGLKEIMGFDVFPWRDAGNDWDVLKGSSIDFGGTDKNRYERSTLHYLSSPVQSAHYSPEAKRVTYVKPSGRTVDLTTTKERVILDSGAGFILLPERIWTNYRRCLQDNGITMYDDNYNPRLKTIEKKHLAKLQPLSFHFVDVEGKEFSIEIPPAGQVFPPSLGPNIGCHDDRVVPLSVVPNNMDVILLGIPVFQRRYVIFDLTTDPYRIGFAEKGTTDYVNPSIQEIMNRFPRLPPIAPKPERHRESQGESSHTSRHRRR